MILDAIRPFLAACLVAVLGIATGAGFGVAFGAFEDDMKSGLKHSADAVLATTYGGDEAKAKAVVDKSWVYYKRAHLHGGALGTQALVLALVLAALSSVPLRLRQTAALSSALGSLGYGWFWYLAGRAAPGLGGTGAAKESYAWLAQPSAGLLALGIALTVVAIVMALIKKP
jgi:hypothetical protein